MDDVRFAQLADGREIAYRVMSETAGPVVLHTHGVTVPAEILNEDPMYDRFLRTLGQCAHLVVFDKPGTGGSDPFDRDRDYLGQTVDAYLAVLDALDAPDGWLVGHQAVEAALPRDRSPIAAARCGFAQSVQSRGSVQFDVAASITDHRDDPAVIAPSRIDDLSYRAWIQRGKRMGSSGVDAHAYEEAWRTSVRRAWAAATPIPDAPPVLLIHRRDGLDISHHHWWSTIFPDAECVTIEGADISISAFDAGLVAELMAGFISGTPVEASIERRLLTVLFTDLVDSTPTATAQGDAIWRSTLNRYEIALRRTIEQHHGTVIKHTGDGALATFPLGSQAIAAAIALRGSTRDLDLDGRTGIHLGEIEQRGDDIGGIAVILADHVMAEAGPGEIVITSSVEESTVGGRYRFSALGARTLKGIARPWTLFRVHLQDPDEPHRRRVHPDSPDDRRSRRGEGFSVNVR